MSRRVVAALAGVAVAVLVLAVLAVLLRDRDGATADAPGTGAETAGLDRATDPSSTVPAPVGSSDPAPAGPVIRTARDFYWGRPYETIEISGRYVGAEGATQLRVQVRRPDGWETFPLPAVTEESGTFRAFVELGLGQYRVRLLDPATGSRSEPVTVLLF